MLALDGSVSPYLPTREIRDALAVGCNAAHTPAAMAQMLRSRLAMLHGVAAERISLFPHDRGRFERLAQLLPRMPWVAYTPGTPPTGAWPSLADIIEIELSASFRIESDQIVATPIGSVAVVATPNDPTGAAIGPTGVAHLARRAGLLVIDERSAEMQRRSLIPLVEEFDSIVLLRSFSEWAGLGANMPGYAISSSQIAAGIDRSNELQREGLHAALAAVSNASELDAIAQAVRLERQRLYRMLRKLNMVRPYPSDAGYVLARVERGSRDEIAQLLADRGIAVYSPAQERLRDTLRFTAISPVATWRLREALIAIGREIT